MYVYMYYTIFYLNLQYKILYVLCIYVLLYMYNIQYYINISSIYNIECIVLYCIVYYNVLISEYMYIYEELIHTNTSH